MSYDLTRYIEVGECHEWTGRFDMGKRTSGPIIKTRVDGKAVNLTVPRNTTAGSKKIGARNVCKECVDKRDAKKREKAGV